MQIIPTNQKIIPYWVILFCCYILSVNCHGQTILNIPYKPGDLDPYEKEACKLNLYLPDQVKDFPVLVYFHGGNLVFRDKDSFVTLFQPQDAPDQTTN